jgi:hypothetical protein
LYLIRCSKMKYIHIHVNIFCCSCSERVKEVVVATTYQCATSVCHHHQTTPDPWEGVQMGGPQLQVSGVGVG